MKLNRIAAAAATTAAAIALISGAAITHHGSAPDPHRRHPLRHRPPRHRPLRHAPRRPHRPRQPPLSWLESPGGQAQVTFNPTSTPWPRDLQIEAHDPTVANHLAFEADARTVRTQAHTILTTRALLPTHNRAAYQRMLQGLHHRGQPAPARPRLRHHHPGLHRLVHRPPRLQHHHLVKPPPPPEHVTHRPAGNLLAGPRMPGATHSHSWTGGSRPRSRAASRRRPRARPEGGRRGVSSGAPGPGPGAAGSRDRAACGCRRPAVPRSVQAPQYRGRSRASREDPGSYSCPILPYEPYLPR